MIEKKGITEPRAAQNRCLYCHFGKWGPIRYTLTPRDPWSLGNKRRSFSVRRLNWDPMYHVMIMKRVGTKGRGAQKRVLILAFFGVRSIQKYPYPEGSNGALTAQVVVKAQGASLLGAYMFYDDKEKGKREYFGPWRS